MNEEIFLIPVSYYMKTNMIALSKDQIKRRINEIKNDNVVRLIPNCKGLLEWHINYLHLDKFKRKRKPKNEDLFFTKISNERIYQSIKFENKPKGDEDYRIEISINFKDNYDEHYYRHFAIQIFMRYRKNLYYAIERDYDGFTHIHMGVCGNFVEVLILCDFITKEVFNQTNDVYLNVVNGISEIKTNIHIEPIIYPSAYQRYLKKGDDKLGNAQLFFLNV